MDRQLPNHSDTDVFVYSFRTQELKPLIATPFNEASGTLSPDGALFAWVSDESGHPEVYVARYPSLSDRRQISSGGGLAPRWRKDGRELFYGAAGGQLMAVDVTKENATPQALFSLATIRAFDVSADGQRFLVSQSVDDVKNIPLTLVTNWTAAK